MIEVIFQAGLWLTLVFVAAIVIWVLVNVALLI